MTLWKSEKNINIFSTFDILLWGQKFCSWATKRRHKLCWPNPYVNNERDQMVAKEVSSAEKQWNICYWNDYNWIVYILNVADETRSLQKLWRRTLVTRLLVETGQSLWTQEGWRASRVCCSGRRWWKLGWPGLQSQPLDLSASAGQRWWRPGCVASLCQTRWKSQ